MAQGKRVAVVGVPGGWSSERLADALAERTGHRQLMDMNQLCLELDQGRVMWQGQDLRELDGLVIKKVGPSYSPRLLDRLELLRALAGQGLAVFSPPERIIRVLNRLSCTVSLRLAGIPMPATVVTEDPAQALKALERLGRCVLKPLYTSKARGMALVEPGPHALEGIRRFQAEGNELIYLQQMVDLPGRDLGVVFLGGRYLATYARTRAGQGSWSTTTMDGGKYQPHEPSPQVLELAQAAQDIFKLDFTCVDVAETPQGPMVFEVSAFGGFRGLWEASRLDAARLYADHVLERIKA